MKIFSYVTFWKLYGFTFHIKVYSVRLAVNVHLFLSIWISSQIRTIDHKGHFSLLYCYIMTVIKQWTIYEFISGF